MISPPLLRSARLLLLLSALAPAALASAEEGESFLVRGKYYNFYFVREHDPLKRGPLTIHAVKVTNIGKGSWVRIAFPEHEKDHLGILAARVKDAKKTKATGVPTAENLHAWENGIKDWQRMWVNLNFVTRITDVEEQGAEGVRKER